MAGFDREKAAKSFNLPEGFITGSVIALGYQGEPDALPVPAMKDQEVAPRQRKPLSEIVLSALDEPAPLD